MDARPPASPAEAQKRRPPYRSVVRGAAALLGLNALLNLPLPASPIQWGWLPALIWILVGLVLAGVTTGVSAASPQASGDSRKRPARK